MFWIIYCLNATAFIVLCCLLVLLDSDHAVFDTDEIHDLEHEVPLFWEDAPVESPSGL